MEDKSTKSNTRKEKVLVAFNGGISSGVAAYLLAKQGFECIGVAMNFFNLNDASYIAKPDQLPWINQNNYHQLAMDKPLYGRYHIDNIDLVKDIANVLNIGFYAVNAQSIYFDQVTEYIVSARLSGSSYSPLVDATTTIFDVLLDKAEKLGCSRIATGHYAKILHNKTSGNKGVYTSNDLENDQSPLLSRLSQKHLDKLILPLAEMRRDDVEKIGHTLGAQFIQKNNKKRGNREFMEDPRLGAVVESFSSGDLRQDGDIVNYFLDVASGTHEGIHQFYLGQSKLANRFNIAIDKKMSVIKMYPNQKLIYVANLDYMKYSQVYLSNFIPAADFDSSKPSKVFLKHDGSQERLTAIIRFKNNDNVVLELEQVQAGILPKGEYVTLYNAKGKGGRILGSGVVEIAGVIVDDKLKYLPTLDTLDPEDIVSEKEGRFSNVTKLSDDFHHF